MTKEVKRVIRKLIVVLLILTVAFGSDNYITAIAATSGPSVTESKKTLYVGYENHTVKFNNILKTAKISYSSSNSKVAKVNNKGVITPVAKGNVTINITVKQSGKNYNLKVAITVDNPTIKLVDSVNILNQGNTYKYIAKSYGIKDKIVWSVSNKSIASINSKGELTALKEGKVIVYAKAAGKIAKCDLVIGSNRLGTLKTELSLYKEKTIWISINNYMENEKLLVELKSKGIIEYKLGNKNDNNQFPLTIKPKKTGKEVIKVTSNSTKDFLAIHVTVVKENTKVKKLNRDEINKLVDKSIVEVNASITNRGNTSGTGFYIGNGMVVTNYHVIEGADNITIITADNKSITIQSIIGYNKELDIAILASDIKNNSLILSQKTVTKGEEVFAISSKNSANFESLSSKVMTTRTINKVNYIQLTGNLASKYVGGPLLNAYGEVIGINTIKNVDGQNLSLAIDITELEKISTNSTITVTDFNKYYKPLPTVIYEDASVSQNPEECQFIISGVEVRGKASTTENIDIYKFVMEKDGKFYGSINSNTREYLKNTYFELFDENFQPVTLCYVSDYLYQYFDINNLKAGTYYIGVYVPLEYTGPDISYSFKLTY